MANLFSESDPKQLSRSEKMLASRKSTTDFTKEAIKWLNDTGQLICHRSNNHPGHRLSREKKEFKAFDEFGLPIVFEYEKVEIYFKSNNIKETILDISGFRISDGLHLEIEVKTKKDTLSQGQKDRIETIKKAGGISFVIDSMETLKLQIQPYLIERKLAF